MNLHNLCTFRFPIMLRCNKNLFMGFAMISATAMKRNFLELCYID